MTIASRTDASFEHDLQLLVRSGSLPAGHPVRSNPHDLYDRMRTEAPVYWSENLQLGFVTSYDETHEFVRDQRWSRKRNYDFSAMTEAQRMFLSGFGFQDPPEHTRLRRLCAAVFTPRAVEEQRVHASRIAAELFADLRERESFDFLMDFAYPMPRQLISDMLGIPTSQQVDFVRWSQDLSRATEPRAAARSDGGTALHSSDEMMEFFRDLFAHKRKNPGPDMSSRLLQLNEAEPDRLADEELMATVVMLYQGGFSTTTNILANLVYTLLKHEQAYADLRSEPDLVPGAVEEILRFESTARNTLARTATEPIDVGDVRFDTGQQVFAILGAANRDPKVFDHPHTFDIRRPTTPRHIGFGGGIHVCIGASLARVEAQEVARRIAADVPRLSLLIDRADWVDSFVHRRMAELPVAWS